MPQQKMQFLSRAQSRRIDQIAIEDYGFSSLVLMENAGRNCAHLLAGLLEKMDGPRGVAIACGAGNNGGDGYVIARHLWIYGIPVKIILFCDPEQLHGDAAANYQILTKMNIPIEHFQGDWNETQIQHCCSNLVNERVAVFVDAWLGTGALGPPRTPLDRVIPIVNRLALTRVAIDIPSGLDCDTGIPNQPTFAADLTLTFVTSKLGFTNESAQKHLGNVSVVGIGIPQEIIDLAGAT